MTIADLFLRTYPYDYRWLPYLIRSMRNHVRGWRDLLIVLPRSPVGGDPIEWFPAMIGEFEKAVGPIKELADKLRASGVITGSVRIAYCDTYYKDDYLGQCITKLRAWEFSDADEIGFLDSDLVFVREWTPNTFRGIDSKKLRLEVRSWDSAQDAKKAWFEVTTQLLGAAPAWETMCRHPFQYPTQFLRRVWNSVSTRVFTGPHISEFNLLGNYAWLHERDNFNWGYVDDPDFKQVLGPDVVKQFWSHTKDGLELEDELRRLGVWEDET